MTECQAPELQDLFPEYVAEMLDDAERSQVHAHLASCPACAGDVAVLRMVRAMRPQSASLDAARMARIVAALPKPPQRDAHPLRPMLVRTAEPVERRPDEPQHRPVAPSIAAPSRRRRITQSTLWRVAATVTVMVAGASSVLVARHQADPGAANVAQLAATESLYTPALLAESLSSSPRGNASLLAHPDVPVSYGDLGDYTEEELQGMLDRLDQWDGATSTDPLPGVPIVAMRGGAL